MSARILIVEDNAENLRLTSFLLDAFGHHPIGAMGAEEGISVARSERPDLILMDIQMPEMNGFEALELIRADADLRAIPVVALTALAMVGDKEAGLGEGFTGYITKPIAPESFVELVDGYLPVELRSTFTAGLTESG